MNRVTKAFFGLAVAAGLTLSLSAQAQVAAGVYFGPDPAYGPRAPVYGPAYQGYGPGYYGTPDYGPSGAYDSNGAYGDDQDVYDGGAGCNYYAPPWGSPADYCDYQLWYQPVYFGGDWYSGPIYFRNYGGINWFWLNGGWRRDEWRGPRPAHIDWNNGRNHFWNGAVRQGSAGFTGRGGFDNRRGSGGAARFTTHTIVTNHFGNGGFGGNHAPHFNGVNHGPAGGFPHGFNGGVGHGGAPAGNHGGNPGRHH